MHKALTKFSRMINKYFGFKNGGYIVEITGFALTILMVLVFAYEADGYLNIFGFSAITGLVKLLLLFAIALGLPVFTIMVKSDIHRQAIEDAKKERVEAKINRIKANGKENSND